MRRSNSTDEAERTTRALQQSFRPTTVEAPEPGDRFLAPSGRIWTVQAITARGNRIVLTTPTPDGDSGAIVDLLAIAKMIPIPIATSSPDNAPTHWTTGGRAGVTATPRTTPTDPCHPRWHRPRPLTLLLAIAAVVIALFAFVIAGNDDGATVTQQPAAAVVAAESPAASDDRSAVVIDRAADRAVTPMHFYGCDRLIGMNRC